MAKRLLLHINSTLHHIRNDNSFRQMLSGVMNRCLCQSSKSEREEESTSMSIRTKVTSSDNDELTLWKWKIELDWLSKALEPALQLYKWASSTSHYLLPLFLFHSFVQFSKGVLSHGVSFD